MVDIANEPAVVLIAVVFAAALLVAEAGLPTFGLAGLTGAVLIGVAVVGIQDGDMEWWPLSLTAVAVGLWCVMIARRSTSVTQQAVAVGLFAAGSIGFGVLEADVPTIVLGLLGSAGLAFGFPVLFERATRLFNTPSTVGMEAYVGQVAKVTAWEVTTGTVQVEGSWWNATGPAGLVPGDDVVISEYEGSHLTVRRPAPKPGGRPMTVPPPEQR